MIQLACYSSDPEAIQFIFRQKLGDPQFDLNVFRAIEFVIARALLQDFNEYKRGISSWNFDIEDLKSQASLIPENEDSLASKDPGGCSNSLFELDTLHERISEHMSSAASCSSKDDDDMDSDGMQLKSPRPLSADQEKYYQRTISYRSDCGSKVSGASYPNNIQNGLQFHGSDRENGCSGSCESEIDENNVDAMPAQPSHERKFSTCYSSSELTNLQHERRFSMSSSCSPDVFPPSKGESLKQQNQQQNMGNCNGDVSYVTEMPSEAMKTSKSSASNSGELDDKSKPSVVQQKGRFKVTSEKVDLEKAPPPLGLQKSHSMQVISQIPSPNVPLPSDATSNVGSLFQQMQCILQTTMLQRDYALSVMRQLCAGEQSVNRSADGLPISASTISVLEASLEREKELIQEVTDLQMRNICKDDEIQRLKAKLAQANIM